MSCRHSPPWAVVLLLATGTIHAAAAAAETAAAAPQRGPGQDDLDAAIDAKFDAETAADLDRVLDLCRRALAAGLDGESRPIAEQLLTGTLFDRAGLRAEEVFAAFEEERDWQPGRALALVDLQEALDRDPRLGQAHLLVARLQSLPDGDRPRAVAAARRALELSGDEPLEQAGVNLVLAELEDDPQRQAACYDAAVRLAPRDAFVRRGRGLFRFGRGDMAGAREDLAVAAAEDPEDPQLQQELGAASVMSGRVKEGVQAFDRALELEPGALPVRLQRGRARMMAGDAAGARADAEAVLAAEPGQPLALVVRAQARQAAGDADGALADATAAIEAAPDLPEAFDVRGVVHGARGDYAAAIDDMRRLAELVPDQVEPVAQLGLFQLLAGRPRAATRTFSRALEMNADDVPSRRGRGDAAIATGDHAAAVADLERALALAPRDTGALNNLAWLRATSPEDGLRDGARAVDLARQGCELTEWRQPHVIGTLAAAHAEAGDFQAAEKFVRQALAVEGLTPDLQRQFEGELASYAAGKPIRERQTAPERE